MAGKKKALVIALVLLVAVAFGAGAQAKVKAAFIISNMANESQAFSSKQFLKYCLLYTSPSPRDRTRSRMPSSA